MIRKIVLNIHIYGGLLCFSYLMILGISTLNFNHPFQFTTSPGSVMTWTQSMELPELAKTDGKSGGEATQIQSKNNRMILRAMGSFAADSPGVGGNWTDADTYRAHFSRPGKEYQIDVHPGRGSATITQTRMNVWALMRELHGLHAAYPDSVLAGTWAWYTDLSTFVLIAAGIAGVYLWAGRRRERRVGLILLASAAVVSISLMLLITFHE